MWWAKGADLANRHVRLPIEASNSFLVEQDFGLEHELGVVADFVLFAEVNLVCLFAEPLKLQRVRIGNHFCNWCYLHFLASVRLSIRGPIHSIVHLIASVEIELEVWRHGCLDLRVKSLLHLLPHVFIVVSGTELLVELLIFLGGIETLNRHSCSSCGCGLTGFATKRKRN